MKHYLTLLAVGLLCLLASSCSKENEAQPEPTNTITVYVNPNFTGNKMTINLNDYSRGECIDLHSFGFGDTISSIEWDLKPGVEVELRKDLRCTGGTIDLDGVGEYSSLAERDLDNEISSCSWK